MKRHILFAFGLLLLLSCFVLAQSPANSADPQGYLLGPGDKIQVKVLGEKDFDFTTEIARDGKFVVPFIEDKPVEANCRTEMDLRKEVADRYSKYLKNPLISLTVTERRKPSLVTVYGEVMKPQQVELTKDATLMEMLALSGGVNKESAGGTVQVVRTQIPMCAEPELKSQWEIESNKGTIAPSKMYSISSVNGATKEANPQIYPGDIIFVEKAAPVYINGEVTSPQGIYIKEGGLSLSRALAMVGGPRDEAQLKEVKIYRQRKDDPLNPEMIVVNVKEIMEGKKGDIMLEPYDIIDIDKKKKSIGLIILETLSGAARSGATSFITGGANRVVY